MKTLCVIFLTVLMSSCAFVTDLQKHCKPEIISQDVNTGSFNACLKCDSLAGVVYSAMKKQIEKK